MVHQFMSQRDVPCSRANSILGHRRRSLAFINKVPVVSPSAHIHRGLAGTTVLVGIAGQVVVSVSHSTRHSPVILHMLFGVMLFSAIVARFLWELHRTRLSPAIDIRALHRELNRQVYILMYGLAGVKELVVIAVYIWRGGAFAVGGMDMGRHIRNDAATLPPFDDFQIYVIYGVAAIYLIRVLLAIYSPTPTR